MEKYIYIFYRVTVKTEEGMYPLAPLVPLPMLVCTFGWKYVPPAGDYVHHLKHMEISINHFYSWLFSRKGCNADVINIIANSHLNISILNYTPCQS